MPKRPNAKTTKVTGEGRGQEDKAVMLKKLLDQLCNAELYGVATDNAGQHAGKVCKTCYLETSDPVAVSLDVAKIATVIGDAIKQETGWEAKPNEDFMTIKTAHKPKDKTLALEFMFHGLEGNEGIATAFSTITKHRTAIEEKAQAAIDPESTRRLH